MADTGATCSCLFSALHHLRLTTSGAWWVQAAGQHPPWWRCAWPASTHAFCDVSCQVAQQRPPARPPQSWPERQRAPERSRSMRPGTGNGSKHIHLPRFLPQRPRHWSSSRRSLGPQSSSCLRPAPKSHQPTGRPCSSGSGSGVASL